MYKFKTAICTNYWKGHKVPWLFVHPIPGKFKSYEVPVADITIEVESGPDVRHMTATRVIAGGVLLGPVGLLLGGMAKKDATHNSMVITFEEGVVRIPFNNKEWAAAQRFIESVSKLQSNA